MPNLKLTYFDFPGSRGEECRLALHIAGVEFEDDRIKGADWPALKPQTPFGSLPVLHVEGHGEVAESNAILVYVGRLHDLHPSDPWQAARHEQILSAGEALRSKVFPVLSIKGEDECKKARSELASGDLQTWGRNVERQLGDGPFLAGDKLQVADIKLYMLVRWFAGGSVDHIPADVFKDFPKLMGLYEAVKNHPEVIAWYAE